MAAVAPRASLRLSPVIDDTPDIEGTPRVVIEAQLRGVPVIAIAVGGIPTLVSDEATALLAPRGDATSLASATLRLIEDDALRTAYAASARAHAGRWSIDTMATSVQEVYELAVGRPS